MTRWLLRLVAVASIALSLAFVVPQVILRWSEGPYTVFVVILNATNATVYVGVGWLIAERLRGNPIGPMLVAIGLLYALGTPADQYLSQPEVTRFTGLLSRLQDPTTYALTQAAASTATLFLAGVGFPIAILGVMVIIVFPDGRLPSPRWRWVMLAGVVMIIVGIVAVALDDGVIHVAFPTQRSPFGVAGFPSDAIVAVTHRLMEVFALVAAIALIGRWRRDDAEERAQIKWVVAAVLLLLATRIVDIANEGRPYDWQVAIVGLGTGVAFALVAIAIGVAILRYHLYDIDRVISRSLGWAVLTGILLLVFASAVFALQRVFGAFGMEGLLGISQDEPLVVAASTLIAFAAFQPLRYRVQRAVDRRFDRGRYDAERTAIAFSDRLRHETDMATVTQDLVRTTDLSVAPSSLSVWLRHGPAVTSAHRTTRTVTIPGRTDPMVSPR